MNVSGWQQCRPDFFLLFMRMNQKISIHNVHWRKVFNFARVTLASLIDVKIIVFHAKANVINKLG